jgi:hypothetical protein
VTFRDNPPAVVQIGMAMTTIARSYRAEPPRGIDVRCSAVLPARTPDAGRCQLFAGHDGPHAVMFAHCGKRVVRTWKTSNPAAAADLEASGLQRPWMYGYPVPAWFETEAEPKSAG